MTSRSTTPPTAGMEQGHRRPRRHLHRGQGRAGRERHASARSACAPSPRAATTRSSRSGYIYSPAAAKVAAEYPDTNFAVIDGYSTTLPKPPLDNLNDLVFAEEQGSYLVGVAAALKSKAKHVGFVGGVHGDLIKKFEAGYTAGVKSVDPNDQDRHPPTSPRTRTTPRPASRTPTGGKDAATAHVRGRRRRGLPRGRQVRHWVSSTRSRRPVTASGPSVSTPTSTSRVDEAQKPHILTSMLKRIDTAVFDYVKSFARRRRSSRASSPTT